MKVDYLEAADDLDRYVTADVEEYDPERPPPTVVDLPDVERRLRIIRHRTDLLRQLEEVAADDKARIDAWLEERSAIVRREIEWHQASVENWLRAHHAAGGSKTVSLPSGSVSLRQGQHRIEPLTKAPSELVPADYVRTKVEWDRNAIKANTQPGPVAEGVEAPEGMVAHWAVDANGERIPDVVRLVPVADTFGIKL
jgi:phage host-nuclease inhibitor protein Gam